MNAPRHPSEIFSLDGSFSQYGQETLVGHIMYPHINGFYVDVGASCGVVHSNTARLHARGWRGICVEANPDAFALLRRNRPDATLVCAAASDREAETASFVRIPSGPTGWSGLNETWRDRHRLTRRKHDLIDVPTTTLKRIMAEHGAPRFVHYLDIDAEGHELAALRGVDFDAHVFGVIGVETRPGVPDHDAVVALLAQRGYAPVAQLGADMMFVPA